MRHAVRRVPLAIHRRGRPRHRPSHGPRRSDLRAHERHGRGGGPGRDLRRQVGRPSRDDGQRPPRWLCRVCAGRGAPTGLDRRLRRHRATPARRGAAGREARRSGCQDACRRHGVRHHGVHRHRGARHRLADHRSHSRGGLRRNGLRAVHHHGGRHRYGRRPGDYRRPCCPLRSLLTIPFSADCDDHPTGADPVAGKDSGPTLGVWGLNRKLCSAVSYSPTLVRVQYHWRWRA